MKSIPPNIGQNVSRELLRCHHNIFSGNSNRANTESDNQVDIKVSLKTQTLVGGSNFKPSKCQHFL